MKTIFPPREGVPRLKLWRTMAPPDDDALKAVLAILTAVLASLYPTKRYRITWQELYT